MPIRKDKRGRWHAEVCIDNQRIHRVLPPGAGKKDAERTEAEIRKALEQREVLTEPPLTEIMALYFRHAATLRSVEKARQHASSIDEYLNGKRASDAKAVANTIIDEMRGKGYKPATINRRIGTLKKGLSLAWDSGLIPVNYGAQIKRLPENNAREVFLTLEQVKAIADHASDAVQTAIWIALYTGMRRGEILKLQKAHISKDVITIPAGNTKTLKMRSIPIIEPVRPWLEKIPMTINFEGLKSGFARARLKANMAHVHFHDLRHSTASLLAQAGVDLHTISKILGHSTTRMSERYAHIQVDQQRNALEKVFGKE